MPSMTIIIIVILATLLISLFSGCPVSSCLGFTAIAAMVLFMGPSHFARFATTAYTQGTNVNQMVLPLFVLMAEFMAHGGIADDIFTLMNHLMKRVRGGLALSATLACTVFAALCGSAPATAASIGRVSISQMSIRGYKPSFAAGTVAAGGTLGIMIPPSINFVLYGIISENSIAKLLIAGLLPGLLISGLMCLSIIIRAHYNPSLVGVGADVTTGAPETQTVNSSAVSETNSDLGSAMKTAIPALFLIVLVLGCLYTGVTTPTECAGIGAIGAFLVVLIKRKVTSAFIRDAFLATVRTASMMLFMMICGMVLSYVVSYLGIAREIATLIVGYGINRWVVMAMLIVLWYVMGCLLDPGSMIILVIPFVYSALMNMGFDPIWLGVICVLCVSVGMITPPVGLNLFILRNVTDTPMNEIIRGVWPYVIVLTVGIIIVCIFPEIATYLPSRM